jgi:hypothetical protein
MNSAWGLHQEICWSITAFNCKTKIFNIKFVSSVHAVATTAEIILYITAQNEQMYHDSVTLKQADGNVWETFPHVIKIIVSELESTHS